MSDKIADLDEAGFDELIASAENPVLIDFWAEWCGPCKAIAPILDEIADEHSENVTIAKVNVDDAASLAQRYRVMSIPTLLVFDGGEEQKRLVGAQSKAKLVEELGL